MSPILKVVHPKRVLYDPAQYDAVKAAGFQSIRFFVVAREDPAIYKNRIQDALDRDLAVVICLWGASMGIETERGGTGICRNLG